MTKYYEAYSLVNYADICVLDVCNLPWTRTYNQWGFWYWHNKFFFWRKRYNGGFDFTCTCTKTYLGLFVLPLWSFLPLSGLFLFPVLLYVTAWPSGSLNPGERNPKTLWTRPCCHGKLKDWEAWRERKNMLLIVVAAESISGETNLPVCTVTSLSSACAHKHLKMHSSSN